RPAVATGSSTSESRSARRIQIVWTVRCAVPLAEPTHAGANDDSEQRREGERMSRTLASCTRGIAIISLCLCSLGQAHAEETHDRSAVLRFGVFIGGGFVDWVGKDANKGLPGEENVPKPGLSAGLLAALDLSSLLSLGIEPFHLT